MSEVVEDLNEVISAAVKAQVNAKVLEALSGNEFFATWINNVLNRPVEIPDPKGGYNRKITVAYVDHMLAKVIQEATKVAVEEAVAEQQDLIRDAVRKSLKRQAEQFADDVAASVLEASKDKYRIQVSVQVPPRQEY